ncbi:MAG: hypothetical protein ACE3L7_24465 [Candidatus Pristimantibacillus sp.]
MRQLIRNVYRKYIADRDGTNKRLKEMLDAVSGRLGMIVIMLLLAVVLSQIVLQNDFMRLWLTGIDRWEGTAFE